jgi:benzoate/toluate 1,2-dioxygenase subunit beta
LKRDRQMESTTFRDRLNDFLTLEAELIDSHEYDAWLELWDQDGIYWIPCNEDDYDPRLHISIAYDDYSLIKERCLRLTAGGAHSQEPRSRLCHVYGNVRSFEASDDGLIDVSCKVVLLELRSGLKNVYGGRWEYRLRPFNGSFKIARKKIVLIDNDEPLDNLSFLL